MKIGELAKLGQCTVETVRYYEQQGLLPIARRTSGNYRLYDSFHLERLRLIRNCRALDLSHKEVRLLLQQLDNLSADCQPINDLVDKHIGQVEKKISELQSLKKQLINLRQKCHRRRTTRKCGILRSLRSAQPKALLRKHGIIT